VIVADPQESSLNPITWYAPKLAAAAGVLINFAGADRTRAEPHNSRNAFVAGMAAGLEVSLLIVAEGDYVRPFDYESMLGVYSTAAQCLSLARPWLDNLDVEQVKVTRSAAPMSELMNVRLGEHVAENEISELADYFVRTAAYRDVVDARDTLFVGHRGTGKTANAVQAFNEVSADRESFAVLIKPSGFEFPGLLATIDALPSFTHDYLFDTIWRFLVQTELCAAVLASIDRRPGYLPNDAGEDELIEYTERAPFDIKDDIAVRLDQALRHLRWRLPEVVNVESGRVLINEAFHEGSMVELRRRLGPVLKDKRRVAVFVDNLDKGWERNAPLATVARLILGLLTAKGHIVRDFNKESWWRDRIKLTVAVFLRSDIFTYVKKLAREPDKLSTSAVAWPDQETLMSVLHQRLVSGWTKPGNVPQLWGGVFPENVEGIPTPEYLMKVVLPRPRDLVYLSNAAISHAIDRRHDTVYESDILVAIETYSQYAYEALLVENGITIPEMEELLFSFLARDAIVTHEELLRRVDSAGITPERREAVIGRLVEISFVGIEIRHGEFAYPEIGKGLEKAVALARRLQPNASKRRYQVHRAFHQFLDVSLMN
jgi:hypothetical protein